MKKLLLFDVDGTLAKSTFKINPKFKELILNQKEYDIGVVGGSNIIQITEQLGQDFIDKIKFTCSQNGVITYKHGKLFHSNNIKKILSEEQIQFIINKVLLYIIAIELPFKRGHFIDFRDSMLYITPIGRNCTLEERKQFVEFDKSTNCRKIIINELKKQFKDLPISFALGGEIGFAIHPIGWDKSYSLQFFNKYTDITFFGDRCEEDGNDFPLYNNKNIKGYHIKNGPEETLNILKKLLN